MTYLFTRTAAQGLQAFVPVAVLILWLRTTGRLSLLKAVFCGIAAGIPATIAAGLLFARAQQQARWEAGLATMSLVLAVWFVTLVFRDRPGTARTESSRLVWLTVATATTMVITRQTMEIFTVLSATGFDMRLDGPAAMTAAGALAALAVSAACVVLGSRLDASKSGAAIRTFAIGYALQVGFYGLHEAAEAGLLPASAALHAATEPYGPDSEFGQRLNYVLLLVASAAAGVEWMQRRMSRLLMAATVPAVLAVAAIVFVVYRASVAPTPAAAETTAAAPASSLPAHGSAVVAFSTPAHLLFRHTHIDNDYGKLGISLLDAADGPRATADLSCERVSFSTDRGICLSADRGVTNTYRAILFDKQFKPFATIPLDGSPSRTRVSADGRLGAATVFLSGAGQQHSYAATTFSTKTILVDMSEGKVIADLEQFTAFLDGKKFHAADFNYWGVTFASDDNTFYATLRTASHNYLVRGDIAKRQFTVLRDGVECPSLSPDGKTIVFKKKVDPRPDGWRYYALDVATLQERPTAATTFVDDQAEWLDNEHVLYALPHLGSADVYVARTDGSERSRLFMHDAQSPIVVR